MKYIINLLTAITILSVVSCVADPQEVLEGTDWQKDRNVTSLLLDYQIGEAVVERDFDDAQITVYAPYTQIADFANIEVKSIELGYGATSTVATGTFLDFSSGNKATIEVTSGSGETLVWTINLEKYQSDLEGVWSLGEMGASCNMFTWSSWGWWDSINIADILPESSPELDNKITFTVISADENGDPYGTYNNEAGEDGVYGEFTDVSNGWDADARFRQFPKGKGSWSRSFSRNKVIITAESGEVVELDIEVDGDAVKLFAPLAYDAGSFDWDNTNWNYEKIFHMSNPMWYKLINKEEL